MKRFILAVLLVFALAATAQAEPLLLAAGAGYKKLVTELAGAFTGQSGQKVELVFGNMGQVTTQAKSSGKIQMIIGERGFLEKAGISMTGFVDLGRGTLVLAWPKGKTLASLDDLAKPGIRRLAMPDPQKAIYGLAGKECLAKAGLADAVKDKVLVVATVPQVTTYLVMGEVDAGLTNLTDVADLGAQIGGYFKVEQRLYSPIVIGAATVANGGNADAVAAFIAFLKTPEAQGMIKKHGL